MSYLRRLRQWKTLLEFGSIKTRKGRKCKMSMVDVSEKPEISRKAVATGTIKLKPETIRLMKKGQIAKGDPSQVAKVAGILAAKKTSELVALCHPLPLTSVEVDVKIEGKKTVRVTSNVKAKVRHLHCQHFSLLSVRKESRNGRRFRRHNRKLPEKQWT